jgi:hypothetical protein
METAVDGSSVGNMTGMVGTGLRGTETGSDGSTAGESDMKNDTTSMTPSPAPWTNCCCCCCCCCCTGDEDGVNKPLASAGAGDEAGEVVAAVTGLDAADEAVPGCGGVDVLCGVGTVVVTLAVVEPADAFRAKPWNSFEVGRRALTFLLSTTAPPLPLLPPLSLLTLGEVSREVLAVDTVGGMDVDTSCAAADDGVMVDDDDDDDDVINGGATLTTAAGSVEWFCDPVVESDVDR